MARHDRSYLRYQRDRIIKKRIAFLKRINYSYMLKFKHTNQFAIKHPLDCGNPKCGVCHTADPGRRSREKREWQNIENNAW